MDLLTVQEIQQRLKLESSAGAKRLMERWGIKPYDLGRGRGLGLRYDWFEIVEFLKSMRQPMETSKKQRRSCDSSAFFSKPWREAEKELTPTSKKS